MSSIFMGKKALRTQYIEVGEAAFNLTMDITDALLVTKVNKQCRIFLIDNGYNAEAKIYVVHPDLDPVDPANRLHWLNIPGLKPLNFDISGTTGLSIDAGTSILVSKNGTASSNAGKLRIFSWG